MPRGMSCGMVEDKANDVVLLTQGNFTEEFYETLQRITKGLAEDGLIQEYNWGRRDPTPGIKTVMDDFRARKGGFRVRIPWDFRLHEARQLQEVLNLHKRKILCLNMGDVVQSLAEALTCRLDLFGQPVEDRSLMVLQRCLISFSNNLRVTQSIITKLTWRDLHFKEEVVKMVKASQELWKIFPKNIVTHIRKFMNYYEHE